MTHSSPELLENKIIELLQEKNHRFTEEEIAALRIMIKVFNTLKALRMFGQFIFYIIVSLGILMSQWSSLVNIFKKMFTAGH